MAGLEAGHQCLFLQRAKHSHRQVQIQGTNQELPTRLIRRQLQRGLQYVVISMCMALVFFF